jgi:long-chain acyl-CoA synthetase
MFSRSVEDHAERPLFGVARPNGWHWYSYAEVGELVDACRGGLAAAGIGRGDHVGLISANSVWWAVTSFACYGLGAVVVPMYETEHPEIWRYICRDASVKLVVCANGSLADRLTSGYVDEAAPACVVVGRPPVDPGSFEALLAKGRDEPRPPLGLAGDEIASLIYTSGTTGEPKGVQLSHRNICSNISALHALLPLSHQDRSLSFLPWAHSFGHTCELHALVALGASLALCDDVEKILQYLSDVEPTVLISVPRIFNRLYHRIGRDMERRPPFVRSMFERGIQLARKRRQGVLALNEAAQLATIDRLVFSRIRGALGGRLRYAFSGGAALEPEVAELIDNVGITVYEGYGLTETSPVVTANGPHQHRLGSVGKIIDGVRVHIENVNHGGQHAGEIVVYGPGVMRGYHGRQKETARVMTKDGGLRTGDLGYLDADGFLYITGRIKEQYKLQNGKHVTPAPLEETLKLSPYINNIMIYGVGREYNVALVVPNVDSLSAWSERRQLHFGGTAGMLTSARVAAHMLADIGERSAGFRSYERIKCIRLIEQDFSIDNGMLTPTMKIKRSAIVEHYAQTLASLYAQSS